MATSVLMAATDRKSTNSNLPSLPQDHDHQPIRRSSGRRKPKASEKKKQPQRGMGVEKLEKLRLQERWKKMTEINTPDQGFTVPTASFADPTLISASAPVQISKIGSGFGAPSVAQMGLNPNQIYLQDFHGQMGFGSLASDHRQLQTDLFGIGCLSDSGFHGKNVNGISKELSSNPNAVKCYSQQCNACHKKKKVNGENLGSGRVRSDMYNVQMGNVGDCGFLGLNIGDNQNIINQENQGLGIKAPFVPELGYAVGNGKQGVEVVAIHRKGLSSRSEGRNHVLMEYDFFPSGKDDCDHGNDEFLMMKLQVGGSQTSCCSSSSSPSSSMDCIDLSLKLSY